MGELLEFIDDLRVLRKSPEIQFGKDLFAVGGDLERAAGRLDQLDLNAGKFFLERGLQTEGLGRIVSGNAIFDGNVHVASFQN
jgi:hypothetical protein